MKKIFLIIACFCVFVFYQGCRKCFRGKHSFIMINNVDYDIMMYFNFNRENYLYPDTSFIIIHPADSLLVKAHSIKMFTMGSEPLDVFISKKPHDTLSFFYFNADTVRKYPLEVLQRDYKILQRYDLSPQDILLLKNEENDLLPEIPYPPDERMKDMKMWPPYMSK